MRIVTNIITSYARFLTGIAAVFFLTPFTLEMVGIEQFGLWSLCLAVIGVLGLLDLGLSTAAVKYVAECTGRRDSRACNEALSTLMLVYAILGATCLLLVIAAIPAGSHAFDLNTAETETFRQIMLIGGCAIALVFPLSIFRSALIGAGRFDLVNAVEVGTTLLNVALVIVLLKSGWALTGLAIAHACVLLMGPLMLAPLAFRVIPGFRLGPGLVRMHRLREVAPLAVYFMLANIALLVSLRSDALLIKAFMPLSAVAAFAIAARISEYSYLLNKQFSNALMPLVSQSHGSGDRDSVRAVLLDGTRFLMLVATPILAMLFLHAESIVRLWVGPELIEVVIPLRILLAAVFFSTLQLNAANVLGMTGGHGSVAWIMMASAALNVFLSVILIPRFGLAGAAIATLIAAFLLESGLMLRKACLGQGVSQTAVLRSVVPVVLSTAPMVLVSLGIASNWPISSFAVLAAQVAAATAVYAGVVLFVAVKPGERTFVAGWIRSSVASWRLRSAMTKGHQHG